MDHLRKRLAKLGLFQYYGVLVNEGFDDWGTVLHATEADLESLGIKLGHRRVLQNAIAQSKRDESIAASGAGLRVKRKYRRRPKPDQYAPARPVSAYVLFCNQIRRRLESQNLSFAEQARMAGQQWRGLCENARREFQDEARTARVKYVAELLQYEKTPQHAEYKQYLKDFEAEHRPGRNGGSAKLEMERSRPIRCVTLGKSSKGSASCQSLESRRTEASLLDSTIDKSAREIPHSPSTAASPCESSCGGHYLNLGGGYPSSVRSISSRSFSSTSSEASTLGGGRTSDIEPMPLNTGPMQFDASSPLQLASCEATRLPSLTTWANQAYLPPSGGPGKGSAGSSMAYADGIPFTKPARQSATSRFSGLKKKRVLVATRL